MFLDGGTKNLYQVRQWLQPLERLNRVAKTAIVYVSDDVKQVIAGSELSSQQIELPDGLVEFLNSARPKLLLYPNQNVRNFFALRYSAGLHAWISHGESDKAYMFQNTLKRYDFYFAAGKAAVDRTLRHVTGLSKERIKLIGRPQLADVHNIPADFEPKAHAVKVLYAPTWEGVTGATRYSSIDTHGLALVKRLDQLGCQIVYRPHPLSGTRDEGIAKADRQIRKFLRKHYVDESEFGWQLGELDVMITDVSAVAYDWLATGKPLLVTEPQSGEAVMIQSPLFDEVEKLPLAEVDTLSLDRLGFAVRDASRGANLVTNKATATQLRDSYFEPANNPDELFHKAVLECLGRAESLSDAGELGVYRPRGKRLGWLRYPNFLVRLLWQILGKWTTLSRGAQVPPAQRVFAYFSDPFDLKTVRAWSQHLFTEASSGPLVLATNQVTTKILLKRLYKGWLRSRQDADSLAAGGAMAFESRIILVPCVSTVDSELLLSKTGAKEVMYLKDHPANMAALRANGVKHTLYKPEVDPNFSLSHTVIMYDEVESASQELNAAVMKIHKHSQSFLN
jgi:hypothetical protein